MLISTGGGLAGIGEEDAATIGHNFEAVIADLETAHARGRRRPRLRGGRAPARRASSAPRATGAAGGGRRSDREAARRGWADSLTTGTAGTLSRSRVVAARERGAARGTGQRMAGHQPRGRIHKPDARRDGHRALARGRACIAPTTRARCKPDARRDGPWTGSPTRPYRAGTSPRSTGGKPGHARRMGVPRGAVGCRPGQHLKLKGRSAAPAQVVPLS